jgi:prepilin-type N-terminal cleavage/methylation domain-containing protein
MKLSRFRFNSRAFTLVEMLIVLSIIALLAGLTMGAYTYAMRSSKRRVTTGTFEAIKLALERYNAEFGEYPEPAEGGQTVDFPPGRAYDVSGAACLYQALTGDGFDQLKGVQADPSSEDAPAQSDGKTEGQGEITKKMMAEVPQTIWTVKNSRYIIIDGFGKPFQYIKAATPEAVGETPEATTINSTYDLWSYSEDEVNTDMKSIETLDNTQASAKWIKNW